MFAMCVNTKQLRLVGDMGGTNKTVGEFYMCFFFCCITLFTQLVFLSCLMW